MRGRAADWYCFNCNQSNYARRDACHKCNAQRTASAAYAIAYAVQATQNAHLAAAQAPVAASHGKASTYGVTAHEAGGWGERAGSVDQAMGFVRRCGSAGADTEKSGAKGDSLAARCRTGDWTCLQCGNVNFHFRSECNRCHQPRSASEGPGDKYGDEVKRGRTPSQLGGMPVVRSCFRFGWPFL